MDGSQLKYWRKRKQLTQGQAATAVGVELQTWGRWERGATPVPDYVEAYVKEHAPPPAPGETLRTEPEMVADALKMAEDYIKGMLEIPAKYGRATDYRWALSYWFEGAMLFPLVYFGDRGVTPCAAARKAATARLNSVYNAGSLYKTLALLDNCPPQIKALVA